MCWTLVSPAGMSGGLAGLQPPHPVKELRLRLLLGLGTVERQPAGGRCCVDIVICGLAFLGPGGMRTELSCFDLKRC